MMTPRVICVGGNLESLKTIEKLVNHDVNLVGVVTTLFSNEQRGSDYRNIVPFCSEKGIPCFKTADINSLESKEFIASLETDYIFILGWSQIFDNELIGMAKIYGSHPSKLPYGAGRAPVPWSVLEQITSSALTIFEVTEEVDAGDIVFQSSFDIPKRSSSAGVYQLVVEQLQIGFLTVYKDLCNETLVPIQQNTAERTVRAKRIPSDGKINFTQNASSVDLLVRAAGEPFPGAYSFFNGQRVTIWQSAPVEEWHHKGSCGQILIKEKSRLLVQCADKPVWLFDFTSENGESLDITKFNLGSRFGVDLEDEVICLKQEINYLKELLFKNGII